MPSYEFKVRIWKGDNNIKIVLEHDTEADITGITTVNNRPESLRGNPHMYEQLKKILKAVDMWEE